MNILLIGYMYGKGGIQTHTHFLANGLVKRGHNVFVVTPSPMHGHNNQPAYHGEYKLVRYSGLSEALRYFNVEKTQQFDVSLVCGIGWAAMIGLLVNRNIKCRVFFEVMSGKRIGKLDPRTLVHLGFDAIIGQGKPVEERFCSEFGWKKRSGTIPALPEPLELAGEIPIRQHSPLSEKIKFVYFGRLAAHKGVGFLIENWKELDSIDGTLDIYGDGPEQENLAKMIETFGLENKIHLLGPYPTGMECVSLMQSYDIKLLPTWGEEGAPLVLLEAMACGLPFVANGVGGIPDYSNADCRITNGDLSEFIPAVKELVTDLRDNSVNHQRLQQHYRENFSFDALVTRWEQFLLGLEGALD